MTKYSILDLVRLTEDGDARVALDNAQAMAKAAEDWGYNRYWVSEHHNIPGIASAATAVVLAHIGAGTNQIRLGAGGVMLPNHSPLIIAEQFGTLERLFPGRIDLGVGRANGSIDEHVSEAIGRPSGASSFPKDVLLLRSYFSSKGMHQNVRAMPATGTEVPIWLLGTSTYGAQLAATLGAPYSYGSHLMPDNLHTALRTYREGFEPSRQLERPYAMVSVNVCAAATDAEAHHLATTLLMTYTDLVRGKPGLSQKPIADIDGYWNATERQRVESLLTYFVVGSPTTVRHSLLRIIEDTEADELIFVSDFYDFGDRLECHNIIAAAMDGL